MKTLGNLTLDFTKFVVKNAAIGAILFGVNVVLQKLTATRPHDQAARQEKKKIESISQFIKSESQLTKKVNNWLKAHKDDQIKLEGIQMTLISVFVKYTTPLGDVS